MATTDLGLAVAWASIAGGLVALGLIVRFIYRGYRTIEQVLDQVTPNGGNTSKLGDRIQRMEESLSDHVKDDREIQTSILMHLQPKPTPRKRAAPK
jgi:hypothetical protein